LHRSAHGAPGSPAILAPGLVHPVGTARRTWPQRQVDVSDVAVSAHPHPISSEGHHHSVASHERCDDIDSHPRTERSTLQSFSNWLWRIWGRRLRPLLPRENEREGAREHGPSNGSNGLILVNHLSSQIGNSDALHSHTRPGRTGLLTLHSMSWPCIDSPLSRDIFHDEIGCNGVGGDDDEPQLPDWFAWFAYPMAVVTPLFACWMNPLVIETAWEPSAFA